MTIGILGLFVSLTHDIWNLTTSERTIVHIDIVHEHEHDIDLESHNLYWISRLTTNDSLRMIHTASKQ
jgi:hypothetical protein